MTAAAYLDGLIEWFDGNPSAAEPHLRLSLEMWRESGETANVTFAQEALAQMLYELGRNQEAYGMAEALAQMAAEYDREPQIVSLSVRGKVLARRGEFGEAESMVLEAERIVEKTDFLSLHGDVLRDKAEVLRAGGKLAEAVSDRPGVVPALRAEGPHREGGQGAGAPSGVGGWSPLNARGSCYRNGDDGRPAPPSPRRT